LTTVSKEYAKWVPDLAAEERLVYILNGKVLTVNFESELFAINENNLIELNLIDKETLKNDYNINVRDIGAVIKTKTK